MSESTKVNQIEFLLGLFNQLANNSKTLDEIVKLIHLDSEKEKDSEGFIIKNLKGLERTAIWKAEEMLKDETYLNMMYGDDWKKEGWKFPEIEIEQQRKFKILNQEIKLRVKQELDDLKWIGVFHSRRHFEAFKYILSSFVIEEHSKKLFSGFWYEFGGNQKLIRCTAKTYTEWVYKHYLPHEEKKSENLTRSHCDYYHQLRRQIRQYKKTYKNQYLFTKQQIH